MKTDRPIRVGVFKDEASVHRVVDQARASGFRRVTVVTDDPAVQERFRNVCDVMGRDCQNVVQAPPGQISVTAGLIGAGVGLVAGFIAVTLLSRFYGPPTGILNIAIPIAGVVWGAFVGAMVSRAWQGEAENFYDQELGDGEILVAIEDRDPERLRIAEAILRGTGVQPIPLPQG